MTDETMRYGAYLNLDKILDAQSPPGADGKPRALVHHDEMLFVVIHQVYELWFKQLLHELTSARDLLSASEVPETDVPRVVASLHRIHEIQRICVAQFTVLETMSPLDFLAFRDQLGSASGFQSAQFREIEILCGLPDEKRIPYEGGSFETHFDAKARARFERRRQEPSFRDVVHRWLMRTPIEEGFLERFLGAFETYVENQRAIQRANTQLGDEEHAAVDQRLDAYLASCRAFVSEGDAEVRQAALFITAYRDEPLLHWPNALLDSACEFDEWMRIWRYRHARMVERIIGVRVGTGGSSGVGYLDATAARYKIFDDLLQSKTFLVPRSLIPDLEDRSKYAFAKDAD